VKNWLLALWNDEEGAETAEWIVIVALIVAVAIVVYFGVLKGVLSNAVTAVGNKISSAVAANAS
jgi:Flp pilus assembly pilin Flp